jgi:hypothetical protein
MKKLLFILSILLLTSCRLRKEITNTSSVVRDSVVISRLEVVDTLRLAERKIEGSIGMEWLKHFETYTIQGKGVTTNLQYIHDSIYISTIVDSSQFIYIKQYLHSLSTKHNESFNQKSRSKKDPPWFWPLIIIISSLGCIAILSISNFKKHENR